MAFGMNGMALASVLCRGATILRQWGEMMTLAHAMLNLVGKPIDFTFVQDDDSEACRATVVCVETDHARRIGWREATGGINWLDEQTVVSVDFERVVPMIVLQ